jgi:hypothetical protein
MQLKHLLLNFDNEQKLWCISMETLEGTLWVHVKEVTLPRFQPNEQKSSI